MKQFCAVTSAFLFCASFFLLLARSQNIFHNNEWTNDDRVDGTMYVVEIEMKTSLARIFFICVSKPSDCEAIEWMPVFTFLPSMRFFWM